MITADLTPNSLKDESGISRRRLLGVYYTPDDIATILVQWALAGGSGPVLDPSCGGFAFLDAAIRFLSEKQLSGATSLVCGVDIDPDCFGKGCRTEPLVEIRCVKDDFLSILPHELPGSPYAAIVGNPPYVRHHWIKGKQRNSARAVVAESAVSLPGTASLWAYFLLHSLRFLSDGGRLAMLLPQAILQADYAAPIRETLANSFRCTKLIQIRHRLFADTDEAAVVAACSGFGARGEIQTLAVESAADIQSVLTESSQYPQNPFCFPLGAAEVGSKSVALLHEIARRPELMRLGDMADVRIGLVTGANQYFVRSVEDLDGLEIPGSLRHPIVARARWLKGLDFTIADHEAHAEKEEAAFLVRPAGAAEDQLVQTWIEAGVEEGFHTRYKCSLRKDWFRVELPPPSDAFATCARAGSPMVVLNRAQFQNTNATHCVTWNSDFKAKPEAVVVGFLTSAVSTWAELWGRRFGGGALKIEPSTLKNAPIPVVRGAEDVFEKLDRMLRDGQEERARRIADVRVLREGLGLEDQEIKTLQGLRSQLMEWRRPIRQEAGRG